MNMENRELARCKGFDFSIEDHGCPVLSGHFEYDGAGCQGLGYVVDTAFLMRFLAAVGACSLKDLEGKSCWVTHSHSGISKIEPLHKKDGKPFVIAEWQEWIKERGCKASPYEMQTGERP